MAILGQSNSKPKVFEWFYSKSLPYNKESNNKVVILKLKESILKTILNHWY